MPFHSPIFKVGDHHETGGVLGALVFVSEMTEAQESAGYRVLNLRAN